MEGGGLVVKRVQAKVMPQHIFFFTLYYLLNNNLNHEKEMIVLVHENHDKRPNIIPVLHYCSGFGHANLLSFLSGSKYLPKIRFSDVYLLNTNT